jgi:hypothetical protein
LSATKPGKPSKPKPQQNSPSDEQSEGGGVGFDDLLRRMLSTPPDRPKKTLTDRKKKTG